MVWFVLFILAMALWLRTAMDIACGYEARWYQQTMFWTSATYVSLYPLFILYEGI